jgi:hypothetical protein
VERVLEYETALPRLERVVERRIAKIPAPQVFAKRGLVASKHRDVDIGVRPRL